MIIVKYGGSIINPDGLYSDSAIDKLFSIVESRKDESFCFVIGGGKICRYVQDAAKPRLEKAVDKEDLDFALDEIGIAMTKINARHVQRALTEKLEDRVCPELIIDPHNTPKGNYKVFLATGGKPGHSTDYDMMVLAESLKADKVIKISDFPVVLDVKALEFDKEKISTYKPLPRMTWNKMLELVGTEWIAGGNYPLDPKAAVLGKRLGVELYIGQYSELDRMISEQEFVGTIVKD